MLFFMASGHWGGGQPAYIIWRASPIPQQASKMSSAQDAMRPPLWRGLSAEGFPRESSSSVLSKAEVAYCNVFLSAIYTPGHFYVHYALPSPMHSTDVY